MHRLLDPNAERLIQNIALGPDAGVLEIENDSSVTHEQV
jgi:hypothetical protein